MANLVNELAELLYTSDGPFVPWANALEEDKNLYTRLAEVVTEAVSSHLQARNEAFGGAFTATIGYLDAETEIARLTHGRSLS